MNELLFLTEAVALTYEGADAPRISATGEGAVADEIIRIAKESDVPLYENRELVRLLGTLELDEEIPEALYRVIAEIISFAYMLQGKTPEDFRADSS